MPWLLFLPSLERIAAVAITTKVQDGAALILVGLQPLLLNSPLILAAVGLLLGDQPGQEFALLPTYPSMFPDAEIISDGIV